MNKKLSSVLTCLMLAWFLAIAAPASAGLDTYTVGSSGSTAAKDTFGFDETPFLYMKLPEDDFNFASSFWHAPSSSTHFASDGPSTTGERWISLTDWNNVKEVGDWTIDSNVFYSNGAAATSVASFTVTPEPLAMALFFVGGVPIAANLYHKRKKLVSSLS
jgi:hypothetical protein